MKIVNLSKTYCQNEAVDSVRVFEKLNFNVADGQFISIVGPNGCGKTTLLKVIAGLETASTGRIAFNGSKNNGQRNRIGLVFQETALFPWRTAVKNIAIGLEFAAVSKKKRQEKALNYMNAFGLSGFENKYPRQLSGGMRQRVAIARTLITEPNVVLMDEPFAALDAQTRNHMQDYLLDVWKKRRDTILFVTHNVDEAVYMSDRIMVLSKRPAQLIDVINVDIERPRSRVAPDSCRIRKHILDMIENSSPVHSQEKDYK